MTGSFEGNEVAIANASAIAKDYTVDELADSLNALTEELLAEGIIDTSDIEEADRTFGHLIDPQVVEIQST